MQCFSLQPFLCTVQLAYCAVYCKHLAPGNCVIVVCAQEEFSEMGAFMCKGQADGWLRPVVGREYPLDQAADAHVEVIEHKTTYKGKIVLSV